MNKPFSENTRFPGIGRQVTAYLVLSALLLALFVAAVGYRQGFFRKHTLLNFVAADAAGMAAGTPVRLRGLAVGSVREVRMTRAGVEVHLAIHSDAITFVPYGSRARLARDNVIGAAYVEIVPGRDPGARSVAEGETLPYERTSLLGGVAGELGERIDPVIGGVEKAVAWMNAPDGDLRQSLAATRHLMEGLAESREDVGHLIAESRAVATELRKAAQATSSAVVVEMPRIAASANESLRQVGGVVSEELPRIAASTREAMREVGAAAGELRSTSRVVGARVTETADTLAGTAQDANVAAGEARELTGALKRTWPFTRMLDAPATRTLPIDINESVLAWPPQSPEKRE